MNVRLDPAERLLVTWMGHFDKLEGVDALVARLCDRESMKKDRSYKLQDKPDDNLFREGFPSMDSWHALMSMYAGRQAGYHCKAVFNFLNLIETQISNAIAGDALAQATPYVTINSYRVPRNIKSDERIHKDYLRALCGTESFASAFQLLVRMVGDQHMMPDAHSMVALLRMVNKPGFVKDSTIPRICDLTTNLVVDMHRLDVLRSSGVEAPATVQLEKSSDTCMVLNYLITVLCTRGMPYHSIQFILNPTYVFWKGYVELAVSTIEKLKLEGVEIDHVGAEIVIRVLLAHYHTDYVFLKTLCIAARTYRHYHLSAKRTRPWKYSMSNVMRIPKATLS